MNWTGNNEKRRVKGRIWKLGHVAERRKEKSGREN